MATVQIKTGETCYVGNQGSVRAARVTAVLRNRFTVSWKNSVREMTRDVVVVDDFASWINGNTSTHALARAAAPASVQAMLDAEPRIQSARDTIAPRFVVGADAAHPVLLRQMLHDNRFDDAVCEWLRVAKVGDRRKFGGGAAASVDVRRVS